MVIKKNRYLALQVLLAIIAGIATGYYYPAVGIKLQVVVAVFVRLVEPFIGPVIFLSVVIGIGSVGNLKQLGRIGLKSILYFEVVSTLALITGIASAMLVQPGSIDRTRLESIPAQGVPALPQPGNGYWVGSNYMLFTLLAALVLGVLLSSYGKKAALLQSLEKIRNVVFAVLTYIFWLVPVAAFAGMAFVVGRYGIDTLLPLGRMVASVYITMFLFVFIVLGLILQYYKISLWAVLKKIKEELLIVLGTSSSRSVLPLVIEKLESAGCSKTVAGFVVPVGYFLNLTGTSIFMAMGLIFLAQLYNIPLSLTEVMELLGLLMITSKAASGLPGAGFIALTITVSAFSKIPVEGLAILLSVDKFMNEARSVTNTIGNVVATLVIAKSEGAYLSLDVPATGEDELAEE